MAWIESHQQLGRHPKTKAAARSLGISRVQMVGHLHYLWWWALDFAEDGDLSKFDPEDISEEAMWEGDAEQFIQALQDTGFLKDMHINDWEVYTGRLVAQRESNRERQQRYRDKNKSGNVTVTPPKEDVTVTSPSGNAATVPYLTQPDPTGQNQPVERAPAPPPPPTTPKRKPETTFPEDLELDDDLLAKAMVAGLTREEAQLEFEKFRNQAAATDRRQRDWRASWRVWFTNAITYGHVGPRASVRTPVQLRPQFRVSASGQRNLTDAELEEMARASS